MSDTTFVSKVTTIARAWLQDVNDLTYRISTSIGSSLVGFLQSGIATIPRTVEDKERDIVSAFDFMTAAEIADVRARTALVNVSAALAAADTAANVVGAVLWHPAGIYLQGTTTRVLKNTVTYRGSGKDSVQTKGTVWKYTGTSDAVQINNPINSSTAANISIEDLWVYCTTRTAGKAAIADVGSTFLSLKRVGVNGNDYGLILDQSELVNVDECDFELPASAAASSRSPCRNSRDAPWSDRRSAPCLPAGHSPGC